MNKIQPLDQVSSIVASALNHTAKVRKNFENFFILTIKSILTTCGKLNFLSLARHCDSRESRFRQNFKRNVDWRDFNTALAIKTERLCVIALDHSYMRKSGKKTPGLGCYWPGCAGAARRGVEILGFAQIAAGEETRAFPIATQEAELPYIVFQRTSARCVPEKGLASADAATVEVTVWAETVLQGIDIAERVRAALDGRAYQADGLCCRRCQMADSSEGWEADAYYQRMAFDMRIGR